MNTIKRKYKTLIGWCFLVLLLSSDKWYSLIVSNANIYPLISLTLLGGMLYCFSGATKGLIDILKSKDKEFQRLFMIGASIFLLLSTIIVFLILNYI